MGKLVESSTNTHAEGAETSRNTQGDDNSPLLDFNLKLLCKSGVWHSDRYKKGYPWIAIFTFVGYLVLFFGFISEIIICYNNVIELTETLSVFFITACTFVKFSTLIFNRQEFMDLIFVVKSNFFCYEQRDNEKHTEVLMKYDKQSKHLTLIFMGIAIVTINAYIILPLVEGYDHKSNFANCTVDFNCTDYYSWRFPFRLHFYINTNATPTYIAVYMFHLWIGYSHIFLIPGCDIFFVALMVQGVGQLKILRDNLESLIEDSMRNIYRQQRERFADPIIGLEVDKTSGKDGLMERLDYDVIEDTYFSCITRAELEVALRQRLEYCIKHHQTILRFVERLELLINKVMLSQFFTSNVTLCTVAFQIMMFTTKKVKMISQVGFIIGELCQLGWHCYFANQIIEESAAVGTAAYSSQWYHAPEDIKRCLRFIIMRSQKPSKLTIGKFGSLSLGAFASIVRASYTYLMLLNEMNQ